MKRKASRPRRAKTVTHRPGQMNSLEARYALLLAGQQRRGTILCWLFEPITFRLADKTRYTPDFMVQYPDGLIEFAEVKGFWRDDARVKWKVVAEQFPQFVFAAVQERNKKAGGGWRIEYARKGDSEAVEAAGGEG